MTDQLANAWATIRSKMLAVARPDSRFDMDLDSFIPAFEGVETASAAAAKQDAFATARNVFITPDNSMQPLRHLALAAGKTVLIPTYGLKRGFLKLDPSTFEPALALYASWGDGGEHFGSFVPIAELNRLEPIDLALIGAAAVTISGLRFGMGHGYFDVEWNIFLAVGLVSDTTPIWTAVHDVQVLETEASAGTDEVSVDLIFTPTRTIAASAKARPARLRPRTLHDLFGGAAPDEVKRAVRLSTGD